MENLERQIRGMDLTRTDAAIADYILEHLDTVGLQTSISLSQAIGVSDTSVIRFIRKLGFSGYAEFRSEMGNRIQRQIVQNQQDLSPSQKYEAAQKLLNRDTLVENVSNYVLDNLQRSLSKLDNEKVQEVVDIILGSDHKYVAAFRGTACCAQYMASKLILLQPRVIPVIRGDGTAIEILTDIREGDCLILYSFPRYSKICFTLADIAKGHGAKIILITDRLTSPLACKADHVLIACVNGMGFTNSYVAPLCVSEVILMAVSERNAETQNMRIHEMDAFINESELF